MNRNATTKHESRAWRLAPTNRRVGNPPPAHMADSGALSAVPEATKETPNATNT